MYQMGCLTFPGLLLMTCGHEITSIGDDSEPFRGGAIVLCESMLAFVMGSKVA